MEQEDGSDLSRNVVTNQADAVLLKLAALGITEEDVAEAVNWARSEYPDDGAGAEARID